MSYDLAGCPLFSKGKTGKVVAGEDKGLTAAETHP